MNFVDAWSGIMSNKNEEYKRRLLEVVDSQLIQEVDGFYYYFPENGGFITSHGLRIIADELDRRNKDWDDEITKYCEGHNG